MVYKYFTESIIGHLLGRDYLYIIGREQCCICIYYEFYENLNFMYTDIEVDGYELLFNISGLMITSGQRTFSGNNCHLSVYFSYSRTFCQ